MLTGFAALTEYAGGGGPTEGANGAEKGGGGGDVGLPTLFPNRVWFGCGCITANTKANEEGTEMNSDNNG